MRSRFIQLLVILSCASTMSLAQSPSPSQQAEPSIQSLLDRIDRLERRVSELEERERKQVPGAANISERAGDESKPAQVVAPAAPMQHGEHVPSATEVRESETRYPSLQFRGFGDVDFSGTDQKGSTSGFTLGQFVLHVASPLSQKVSYFGEVSFTARPTGYDVAVERTIIRYDYNDFFKLSFGKYHTPVGYWNAAFHHGAWLQTTISRPEMVQIGGTFIPVHFVGLEAEGSIPSGGLGLGYHVGLGNGRSSLLSTAGDAGDSNNNRAWVASLSARPTRFYGLEVGGSAYRDKVSPQTGGNFGEWITSAYVAWTKEKPEILSEFANVHHQDVQTLQTFNSQAFYVQLAYRFGWQENKWKPYYRFERIHRPVADRVFANVLDLVGSTAGVRQLGSGTTSRIMRRLKQNTETRSAA